MAVNEEFTGNLIQKLEELFDVSLKLTVPDEPSVDPMITVGKFGDYQCDNTMKPWSKLKGKSTTTQFTNSLAIGQAIVTNLPTSEMVESCSVTGPGYINVVLSTKWIAKSIESMLINGIHTWAPTLSVKRAVVDFSSPNIAKKMHVGHLRSTIIGDTIARMLEYSKVEVLRRNHVGDWGTQFGMIIEYLFEEFPDSDSVPRHQLKIFSCFTDNQMQNVKRIQTLRKRHKRLWSVFRVEILFTARFGLRFEKPAEKNVPRFINAFKSSLKKRLQDPSDACKDRWWCFTYDTTDMAALWYRLNEEKAEWIIYVTDAGQQEHFARFFKVARNAGWLPENDKTYPRASNVTFGVVNGEDGKRFRGRGKEAVSLTDLLDEAKTRSKAALIERGKVKEWTPKKLDQTAEAVGYGAVKYADLKNNRSTSYVFNFDKMLDDKGDTAVYLLYAYARICSVIEKSGKDMDELKKIGKLALDHAEERALGLHLIRFAETVNVGHIFGGPNPPLMTRPIRSLKPNIY
ncbi:hypothetical protein AALP_AA3G153100 [Arabis alpina]|uniref:arginine--tRNA ligase n=1 Tax=Arabis alpina TaxID=50452 RepID=A0A087H9C9_ARAAL|nr:hypothetical protein AALP_AA3G153100 [Arabis alpina]